MRLRSVVVALAVASCAVIGVSSSHAATPSNKSGVLKFAKRVNGNIAPKSVHASNNGYVAAFNMMYRHNVTIYNATTHALVKEIPDTVRLSAYGFKQYPGVAKGAPVEGAFSPDGKYLYSSNYSMYGKNFGPEGLDTCTPSDGTDRSFAYRINMSSLKIDEVFHVGSVPKVVEVTPDNRYVLVTNWCSWEMNIISTATNRIVKNIYIGRHPRGIVVSPDSSTVYVAEMGSQHVHVINLNTFKDHLITVGSGPRALVLSPDGTKLYATLNTAGRVVGYDLVKNRIIGSVATGHNPRSLTISDDGQWLYAVNYLSNTLSTVRTSTMKLVHTIGACESPIGVAYVAQTSQVWVACYHGWIEIYDAK